MNEEKKLEAILELVAKCPEKLQEKCFEMLFMHHFNNAPNQSAPKTDVVSPPQENTPEESEGLLLKDLHAKVKAMVTKNEITLEQLNDLFYKEGDSIKPLYDDLKSTKMSDSQMRLTLLGALKNAISTGTFSVNIEEVRAMCDVHKCYDGSNFTANFKKNKGLFTEEWKKGMVELAISPEGKTETAKIVAQLAN